MVKFVSFVSASNSEPHIGVRLPEGIVDVSVADPSLPGSLRALLAAGDAAMQEAANVARHAVGTARPIADLKLLPPIADPEKIICAGENYRDHIRESGDTSSSKLNLVYTEGDDAPVVLFNKFNTALIGPFDDIVKPTITRALDWEVELVLVIGKTCKAVPKDKALDFVAGYMVGNDITARDFQHEPALNPAKQHFIGKTPDRSCPTGPWFVTKDEIPDPNALDLVCSVNGEEMQNSNTKHMIHNCQKIVSYCSMLWTLTPGDLIFTGTPSGVGAAQKPMIFLKPGDVVETRVQGLGAAISKVVKEVSNENRKWWVASKL